MKKATAYKREGKIFLHASSMKEFSGTLKEALTVENMKIRNFIEQSGILPVGNKIIK